jgi:transglutaminase-like putative cysteine protease
MNTPARRLAIRHTTNFSYDRPVTRSAHLVHLRPVTDSRQYVSQYNLGISVPASVVEFGDVFGNAASRFEIQVPYTQLSVTGRSTVELIDEDPFAFLSTIPARPTFPLVWMPWERLMLHPYLQPVELPESQLKEITDFGMAFIERNNRDLLETLFAINLTLHRDHVYSPGCTSVLSTPYDFFVSKRGVCQDYANLFVCVARLLDIPARYVCGYIHTGNGGENRVDCDASHAWVELYIPNFGWKGFDPTNGTLPHMDHIRVAYGRNYVDTAPVSGTLYSPAVESMSVDVEVLDVLPTNGQVHDLVGAGPIGTGQITSSA